MRIYSDDFKRKAAQSILNLCKSDLHTMFIVDRETHQLYRRNADGSIDRSEVVGRQVTIRQCIFPSANIAWFLLHDVWPVSPVATRGANGLLVDAINKANSLASFAGVHYQEGEGYRAMFMSFGRMHCRPWRSAIVRAANELRGLVNGDSHDIRAQVAMIASPPGGTAGDCNDMGYPGLPPAHEVAARYRVYDGEIYAGALPAARRNDLVVWPLRRRSCLIHPALIALACRDKQWPTEPVIAVNGNLLDISEGNLMIGPVDSRALPKGIQAVPGKKGVRYVARFRQAGRSVHVGSFADLTEAYNALLTARAAEGVDNG